MPKVILTRGLPATGKTSWALGMIRNFPGRYKRVCKDDLRSMLDGGHWTRANEDFILKVRDELILRALAEGKNVIVDDTNFGPHEDHIRGLVKGNEVSVVEFGKDLSLEEIIANDLARTRSVGEKVIQEMYKKYVLQPVTPYCRPDLPLAIICDVDGTLALHPQRGHYDTSKYDSDIPNTVVLEVVRRFQIATNGGPNGDGIPLVLVVTGRDEAYRQVTTEWLKKYVSFDSLFMRPKGDIRRDSIIKRELFEAHIRDKYNVLFVLDDRDRVVDMWRNELGLTVFQVAEGDF